MPSPPSAPQRLQALTNHLSTTTTTTTTTTTMATETKPPITCHVLDTTIGKPAANIPVLLTLHNARIPSTSTSANTSTTHPATASPITFHSTTNADGRVTSWTPHTALSASSVEEVYGYPGEQRWSLSFDTDGYFKEQGREGFFWGVEVKFVVKGGEAGARKKEGHYHVPVLLGGFGYSTYRGS